MQACPACSSLFKLTPAPTVQTRANIEAVSMNMVLSAVVASPKLLLQLCISTLHLIFEHVFSTVREWTAGGCNAANSHERTPEENTSTTPTSVNYHFTRKCNYKCGFCFHTAKTSFVLPLEEARRGLKLLQEAGKSIRLKIIRN